jgi:hypothetical protein
MSAAFESPPAAAVAVEYSPLAAELLRRAVTTFAAVPAAERGPVLAAIDGFLASPGPAAYLAAAKVLDAARHDTALHKVRTAQARYTYSRGLETVKRELGEGAAATLSAIPIDERAGLRLRALALLAAAHRELAERVAGSAELMWRQLERAQEKSTAKSPSRRRSMSRRAS